MIRSYSQLVHWQTARVLMYGLGVELSLERDRTQAPYRAVYRASYFGLKDNIVMVYQLTVVYR